MKSGAMQVLPVRKVIGCSNHKIYFLSAVAGAPCGCRDAEGSDWSNFAKDIALRVAVLKGMGREVEAEDLRDAAIAGIESEEMRALVILDLADPGTIIREMTSHRMALDPDETDSIV